jgi:hypothetical protein
MLTESRQTINPFVGAGEGIFYVSRRTKTLREKTIFARKGQYVL